MLKDKNSNRKVKDVKMVEEGKQLIIYKKQRKIDNIKIAIILLCICALLCLILIIKNSITMINGYKVYKQYEIQVQSIAYEEQKKTEEFEKEKQEKGQEKIPKLTDKRQKKYREYIQVRAKESIFNI